MTGVIIFLCVAGALLLLALTVLLKGADAMVVALVELFSMLLLLLAGVVAYQALKFLAMLFGGAMTWGLFFQIAFIVFIICVVVGIGSAVVGFLWTILSFVAALLLVLVEKLGEYSETGMKLLIGQINKYIPLS